jgi:predicted ArsR family transcriptional regulator
VRVIGLLEVVGDRLWSPEPEISSLNAVENRVLGPAPVRATPAPSALSGQRAAVLEHLQRSDAPVTVSTLAARLTLHPNTVREHLDALVELGHAARERGPAVGRGRPAWRYSAVPGAAEPDPRVRDYAGLATALAAHIARTSADPVGDALAAGRQWGRELTAGAPAAGTPAAARRRVVELMAALGFDPAADGRATSVALRRCPLLDAATRHPEIVCSVHLGLVRGALEHLGGDPSRTALLPFAEPGACRLHLRTPDGGR